jgi:hypothetical protein
MQSIWCQPTKQAFRYLIGNLLIFALTHLRTCIIFGPSKRATEQDEMKLEIGKQYEINGMSGFVYKFTTLIRAATKKQHWFFHADGHFTHSLMDSELERFIK